MKLILAGSKTFSDYNRLKDEVNEFLIKHRHDEIESILSGGEPGTEQMGELFAKENEIPVLAFPLDTDTYGDEAGIIRDTQMIDSATAMMVFYDGVSAGHPRKQDIGKKRGLLIEVVDYSKPQK